MTAGYFRRMLDEQQKTGEREEKLQEQLAILDSMANIYDYVNLISFLEMSEMSLRDETRLKRHIGENQDHTHLTTGMKKNIIPDMTDDFWEFTNIRTVPERMVGKRSISAEFIDRHNGWFRAQYIRISGEIEREPDIVIFTVQNIAAEKRREQKLIRISLTDELAGL